VFQGHSNSAGGRNIGARGLAHFPPEAVAASSTKDSLHLHQVYLVRVPSFLFFLFDTGILPCPDILPETHVRGSGSVGRNNELRDSVVARPAAEPHLWIVYPSANVFRAKIVKSIRLHAHHLMNL
jgi:hypothetical protein